MSKKLLGLDIGAYSVKLVSVQGTQVLKSTSFPISDHMLRKGRIVSIDAMAEELRNICQENKFGVRNCAVVLSPEIAFTRKITLPPMSAKQVQVNLPYEFHDYIQKDKDFYFYDYAVVTINRDENGTPRSMELLAAATEKERVAEYRAALKKAGLKLRVAMPKCLAYRNLIHYSQQTCPQDLPSEYCVVDLGHTSIRMHMYRGSVYEVTRIIEFGGNSLDALIADARAVDQHIAAEYKLTNYENVLALDACNGLYNRIALEMLRAINFYGFNTPDSNLQDMYIGGGLASVIPLMQAIQNTLELNLHDISELMPTNGNSSLPALCPSAVGAAIQMPWGDET